GAACLCGAVHRDGECQRACREGAAHLRRPGHAQEPGAGAHLPRQPLRLAHAAVDRGNLSRSHRPRRALRAGRDRLVDLPDLIDRNAAFAPQKNAVRFGDASLSYAAFAERIAAAARALKSQLGVGRGDRVAVLATNHPDYLVLLYACARLGAMLVPLNWRLAVPEQVFILTDASVQALVVEEAFAAVIAPLNSAL